jgi:ATP-dependent RNA helicase RhlE
VSFVAPDERPYLRDIERLTKVRLTPLPLPESFNQEAARLPAPSREPVNDQPRGKGPRREQRPDQSGQGQGGKPRNSERHPARADGDRRPQRPEGERRAAPGEAEGGQQRQFKRRGGPGAWRGKVRKAG